MAEAAVRSGPAAMISPHWTVGAALARYSLRVDVRRAAPRATPSLPLASEPCRSCVQGEFAALWLGPDEQLLIGPESTGPVLFSALEAALRDLPYALVDVSHRQTALEIRGPHALELLSAGCPLDLDLSQFPVSACTRTIMAKCEIVLWRRADDRFHLEVWRSFVPYLSGFLSAAGQEFLG